MREVHVANSSMEAHFLRTLLTERGIEAVVVNEMLGQARGELPVDASTAPVVCVVDDARAEEARAILMEVGTRSKGPDWMCSSCGESNGAAFDTCWSCGVPRPVD